MKKIVFLFLIGFIFASCCKDTDIQYYPAELRNMLPYFPGQIIKFADENQDTVVFRCEYAQDELSESIKNQSYFCNKPKSRRVHFVVKFSRLDTLQNKVRTFNQYTAVNSDNNGYIGIDGVSDFNYSVSSEILIRGKKFQNVYIRSGATLNYALDTVVLSNSGIQAFTSQITNSLFTKVN